VVGNTAVLAMNKLGQLWTQPSASTTPSAALAVMRVKPIWSVLNHEVLSSELSTVAAVPRSARCTRARVSGGTSRASSARFS